MKRLDLSSRINERISFVRKTEQQNKVVTLVEFFRQFSARLNLWSPEASQVALGKTFNP